MIRLYSLFALALVAAVALSVAMKESPRQAASRVPAAAYLKFSHKNHVDDRGIACEDCHASVKTSKLTADRNFGTHEICQSCHEEQLDKDCAYCHTTPDNITPIPQPTREWMFSHERHLGVAGIECASCHTATAEDTLGTPALPAMATCTSCHEGKKVSTQCETCHRDFAALLPADHRRPDFRTVHNERTRLGDFDVACSTCHTQSFCQECHTGIELQGFGSAKGLMSDPLPRSSIKDSPKEMKLQQIHGLNYRFTHGIDAKAKRSDCASCHERQTFCAECHESGDNVGSMKIKPPSHTAAGFVTIGRGTGGGRHADLARKDLESCISCHDVQGSDPTCMLCHTSTGGIR